jgi:hypothetical protein
MAKAGKIEDEEARNSRRKRIRTIMRAATAACILVAAVFAASSLERTPITGRWRVIAGQFDDDMDFYRQESEKLLAEHKERLLSETHPVYLRLHEVVTRLLDAACSEEQLRTLGVPDTAHICNNAAKVKWRLAVIDDRRVANACVTPDGTILVFTGLLPLIADETNGNDCNLLAPQPPTPHRNFNRRLVPRAGAGPAAARRLRHVACCAPAAAAHAAGRRVHTSSNQDPASALCYVRGRWLADGNPCQQQSRGGGAGARDITLHPTSHAGAHG